MRAVGAGRVGRKSYKSVTKSYINVTFLRAKKMPVGVPCSPRGAGFPAWCSCHFRALSASIFIPRPRVTALATLVRMARSPFRLRGGILVSWRIPCARLGSLSVSRSPCDIYNIPHRVIECKLFLFVKITE